MTNVDVVRIEGSGVYRLSTPSKNPVLVVGIFFCSLFLLHTNNIMRGACFTVLVFINKYILTFRRHFVLTGTSRQAACTSRKIHTIWLTEVYTYNIFQPLNIRTRVDKLPSVVRVQSCDVSLTGTPRRGTFISIWNRKVALYLWIFFFFVSKRTLFPLSS